MGYVHAKIQLANPRREGSRAMEVTALVDTGANYLCLPALTVAELGLDANTTRIVTTADGANHECRYVGPVEVRFEDRLCYVGALESGNEVLLGAIPMEDMDLVVTPPDKRSRSTRITRARRMPRAKGFRTEEISLRK